MTSRHSQLVTPRRWSVFGRCSLPLASVHLFWLRTGSLREGTSHHLHIAGPNRQPKIFQWAARNLTAKVFRNSFRVVGWEGSVAVQPCPPCTSLSLPPSLSALSFLNTQERLTPLRTPEKVIIINEELKESD